MCWTWIAIGIVALAILVVMSSSVATNENIIPLIISQPAQKEGFATSEPGQLPIGGGADPELGDLRTPYSLLKDALPARQGPNFRGITAASCYDADWNAQNSLTGNNSKFTNNNMPTYPDNCTGPRQEFTGSFY
jgi:hypothetical protein